MEFQKFINQLPSLYGNWGYDSVRPKSEQFQALIDRPEKKNIANMMQLLNLAVACMENEEIYCQIGCKSGENLLGALLNNTDKMAYAVEKLSAEAKDKNQEELIKKLTEHGLDEQVLFCDQGFEEYFFDLREIQPEAKIGVYFYDGLHDYRSELLALLMVKPFLADQALIIVGDNNKSGAVEQAIWDFLATNPQSQLIGNLPKFGKGIYILSWDINQNNIYEWNSFVEHFRNESIIEAMRDLQLEFEEKKKRAIDAMFKEAVSLQQFKRFAEAEQKYKEILQSDNKAADAWHNLGMLYYTREQYEEALAMLVKALQIDDSVAEYHYNLGLLLEKLDKLPEAIRAYEQAIARRSDMIRAYNNIGNIWLDAGELDRAESIYRQAITADPDHYGSYLNLGNVLRFKNQLDEAIECYKKSLQLNSHDPDILHNLGLAYEAKQKPEEGTEYLAEEYFGYAAYRKGKYEKAIAHYQKALLARIGDVAFYDALGDCYKKNHQIEECIKTYQEGIKHHPRSTYLYLMLIISLQDLGMTEEAIKVAIEGSQLLPNDLGLKLEKQRLLPVVYETKEEIDYYRSRFTQHLEDLIQQTKLDTEEAIKQAALGIGIKTNFYLQYQGKNDLELQVKYGEFVHKVMSAKYPQWVKPLTMPPLGEDGKIRVGYISPFLYNHSVSFLALGWLKNLDPEKFDVYTYYTNQQWDSMVDQFWLYSKVFHHIPEGFERICQQIIDDKLHILVFLDIGMDPTITKIAGLRLAPVQCCTWGHPITSGSPTIDYFLSSDLMEPENGQEHYSEQLIRLPNIGFSYIKPELPEPRKTRAELGVRDDAIIYLSSQSTYKYLPQHDYIFPAIAQRVPQAQFVFIGSQLTNAIAEKFWLRLKKSFASMGLNSEEYCTILPRMLRKDYMSLNLVSDIYLDTLAWSGGNTTLQAIACHLPIVTCPGEFMRGRHSYGILKMLGVTETIAKDESEYIEIAVRLGLDPEWRKTIVQKVIENNSRVFEDKACVKALEAFYDRVVRENQQ